MEPVALGVIGCGVIGRVHLQMAARSPLVKVVAVADLRDEAAREAAAKFAVPAAYRDADALLADAKVEAVVLAMPARGRTELALRAFGCGKHVLTEKPVAMNAGEVEQMIAARGRLVGACCSSRFRFQKSAEALTDFIATGALGSLRLVRARAIVAAGKPPAHTPPAWRLNRALNGGGIFVNWGCYDLDYLLGITGWSLRPKLVLAQTWRVARQFVPHVAPGSDAESHVAALILCEGGAVMALERGEYVAAQSDEAFQIIGEKGSVRMRMTPGAGKTVFHDDSSTEGGVTTRTLWQGDEEYAAGNAGPVHDFARAIREGRPPKTSLEQALLVQRITDAIYASAARGCSVAAAVATAPCRRGPRPDGAVAIA